MKIFYLGMQRCGTKSFGKFFEKNGFKVWSWKESQNSGLGSLVYQCKYLDVINRRLFEEFDVFEDAPFYQPEFARFLANYIDDSKFVYLERPAGSWFDSMIKHSNGFTLGKVDRHCYFYDRIGELNYLESSTGRKVKKLPLIGSRDHYVRQYELHKERILHLFSDLPSNRFFSGQLYDSEKYVKIADAFGLDLRDLDDIHVHKSKNSLAEILEKHETYF